MLDMMVVKRRVEDIFPEIAEIRNRIHMNPELSELEMNTRDVITDYLKEQNIDFSTNDEDFGVVGIIDSGGKAIGIRGDIDALPIQEEVDFEYKSQNPGVMHACGHDFHTAILLGTARILNELRNELPVGIKVFFQPAEETVGGAKQMIDRGCLKNPEVVSVIGLHLNPDIDTGKIELVNGVLNATSTEFKIIVKGKGTHGAHPDMGTDSIAVTADIIKGSQNIISRLKDPLKPGVISFGRIYGGTKDNIIPEEVVLEGIIRSFSSEEQKFLKSKLDDMARHASRWAGAKCDVIFGDSYPPLINDGGLYEIVKEEFSREFGFENLVLDSPPSLRADDFAYFCHESRGFYYTIGCHKPGDREYYPIHSPRFDPDINCIRTGILSQISAVKAIWESI